MMTESQAPLVSSLPFIPPPAAVHHHSECHRRLITHLPSAPISRDARIHAPLPRGHLPWPVPRGGAPALRWPWGFRWREAPPVTLPVSLCPVCVKGPGEPTSGPPEPGSSPGPGHPLPAPHLSWHVKGKETPEVHVSLIGGRPPDRVPLVLGGWAPTVPPGRRTGSSSRSLSEGHPRVTGSPEQRGPVSAAHSATWLFGVVVFFF